MTKIIIVLVFTLCISIAYSQEFEGEIVYQCIYKSKIAGISNDSLNTLMGHTQKYFIKEGSFKVESDGTFYQWSIYKNSENKYYNKLSNSDTVTWTNGNINHDSVINSQVNKNISEILGYRCDEIILTTKSGIKKFYFNANSVLSTDPKKFINYEAGNWYDFLSISNSLPLRTIEDNEFSTYELIAKEIIPKKLENDFFNLPANTKIKESE